MACKIKPLERVRRVEHAEIIAVMEGINLIEQMGLQETAMETDSLYLVRALQNHEEDLSPWREGTLLS